MSRKKMIKLELISEKPDWLRKIAEWRTEERAILLTDGPTSVDRQIEWVKSINSSHFFFIVKSQKSVTGEYYDELVGYCGLIKIRPVPGIAELSILVDPAKKRQRIGSLAVAHLLGIAFNELNLKTVYVEAYTNSKRWEFFESMGFEKEGTHRNTKYFNGRYYHSIRGSITREDT